jgi:hypothetical protein
MATGRIGTTPVLQVRWSKAPSDGTTSLSGLDDNSVSLVYSVGYEAVYRNGVLLSRGNDYTATDGTTVTLIDATITGDIIEIFANQTIPLSDTYSQTVADGKFINNTLTTTTGDIIYASGANTPARLAIGTSADVLTVSGGIPAWAAPASGGGLTLINLGGTTLSGASTSVTTIPGTYKNLHIYIENFSMGSNNNNGYIQFNGTTSDNYAFAAQRRSGGSSEANATEANNDVGIYFISVAGTTAEGGFAYFLVPDYAATNHRKVATGVSYTINSDSPTPAYYIMNPFGVLQNSNSAITSVQVVSNGTYAGGTVYVYGEN